VCRLLLEKKKSDPEGGEALHLILGAHTSAGFCRAGTYLVILQPRHPEIAEKVFPVERILQSRIGDQLPGTEEECVVELKIQTRIKRASQSIDSGHVKNRAILRLGSIQQIWRVRSAGGIFVTPGLFVVAVEPIAPRKIHNHWKI